MLFCASELRERLTTARNTLSLAQCVPAGDSCWRAIEVRDCEAAVEFLGGCLAAHRAVDCGILSQYGEGVEVFTGTGLGTIYVSRTPVRLACEHVGDVPIRVFVARHLDYHELPALYALWRGDHGILLTVADITHGGQAVVWAQRDFPGGSGGLIAEVAGDRPILPCYVDGRCDGSFVESVRSYFNHFDPDQEAYLRGWWHAGHEWVSALAQEGWSQQRSALAA